VFSSTASLPALLVFSGRGTVNYSVYHLCAVALVVSALVTLGRRQWAGSRSFVTAGARTDGDPDASHAGTVGI
jgi:hypothetical protein